MAKMIKTKINLKWPLWIPEHRAARPEWHTVEGWERKRLDAMEERIGVGDVVFYVGAEEGEMPALCAKWGAEVVLFEPNDKVWPNIKAIWEANKLKTPVSFAGFASNKTTDNAHTSLYKGFPPSADGPVIGDHGFKELSDPGDIPQIKIDDCTAIEGAITPTVISMDVEGSEWLVLRGAEETLRQHRPLLFISVHPEFMFHQFEQYSSDLRGWIGKFGYTETILDYQHELHVMYMPRPLRPKREAKK